MVGRLTAPLPVIGQLLPVHDSIGLPIPSMQLLILKPVVDHGPQPIDVDLFGQLRRLLRVESERRASGERQQ